MKKSIVILVLLIASIAYSGDDYCYDDCGREGYETADPSTPTVENVEIEQTESSFYNSDGNIGIGTEMILSQDMKYFNLPINFRIRKIKGFTFHQC